MEDKETKQALEIESCEEYVQYAKEREIVVRLIDLLYIACKVSTALSYIEYENKKLTKKKKASNVPQLTAWLDTTLALTHIGEIFPKKEKAKFKESVGDIETFTDILDEEICCELSEKEDAETTRKIFEKLRGKKDDE